MAIRKVLKTFAPQGACGFESHPHRQSVIIKKDMPAQKNQESNQSSSLKNGKIESLKVLVEWSSPSRLFKRLSREKFATIGAIVFLVAIILIFLKEWFLIAVIVALVFFAYILASVQPEEITHQITNKGVMTGGKSYPWGQLVNFWFEQKEDQEILFLDGADRFNFRLMILLGEKKADELRKILAQYLPEEKPQKTWIDKAGEWITRQIPLEK